MCAVLRYYRDLEFLGIPSVMVHDHKDLEGVLVRAIDREMHHTRLSVAV